MELDSKQQANEGVVLVHENVGDKIGILQSKENGAYMKHASL